MKYWLNTSNGAIVTRFCGVLLIGLLLCTTFLVRPDSVLARTERESILFLPFDIAPEAQDLAYLANGLTSMLATRVASRSETLALYRNKTTRQMAAYLQEGRYQAVSDVLRQSKATYLIVSALDRKGKDYRLTSYVFSKKRSTPYILTRTVQDPDKILSTLDEFAWDIVAKVFGKQRPASQAMEMTKEQDGMAAFQTAHPERAYRQGMYTSTVLGLEGEGFSLLAAYRSRKVPFPLQVLDVADIDGDRNVEIVLASNKELLLYQFQEEHFTKLGAISLEQGYLRVHALNLADLDHNGVAEIYISASNGDTPASMVLTWEKREARFLHRNIPLYIRPEVLPGGAAVLLGQPPGSTGPLGETIYSLTLDGSGAYRKEAALALPAGLNIFDFIRTDLDGDGNLEVVAINRNNHLQVFDSKGEKIWQSSIAYGASSNYYGTLSSTRDANRRVYIPTPLLAKDLDNDGRYEVIVGRNRLSTFPYFKRIRYFEGSSIVALTWKEHQLTPDWETRKIAGYTPGYQLMLSGAGQENMALFFADVETSSPFFFWESASCTLHLLQLGSGKTSPALKGQGQQ